MMAAGVLALIPACLFFLLIQRYLVQGLTAGAVKGIAPWPPSTSAPSRKAYGDHVQVLHDIDLSIDDGEFVVLVGPSGCGKSTLLRMIAGLEEITGGDIAIDGSVVNDLAPKDRDIAMVFQSYALYPHMTVADNMSYSLRLQKARQGHDRRSSSGPPPASSASTRFLERTPEGALRRPAPARRHGPRHRARAQGLPVRRAALQPRRAPARADARRDQASCTQTSAPPRSTSPTTRSRR